MCNRFIGARITTCKACGKPLVVTEERGTPRMYCDDACRKWFSRNKDKAGQHRPVRLALATGMRRGECFGLVWRNVDLGKATIHVTQNLTSYDEVKEPKTQSSIRKISIDPNTIAHLKMWKDVQKSELIKLGIKQNDETPVRCNEKGGFMNLSNFERWWRGFRKEAGFEGLRFHELRHTQATQLLANGVDLKTVQDRMGHANGAITLNWYAHAVPENDEKAAQLVGEIFKPTPNKARVVDLKTA